MTRSNSSINDESDFSSLKNEMKNINILLFGETGVGKSTFINAFMNYLDYSHLQTAVKNELKTVIPSKFTTLDDNYNEKVIQIKRNNIEYTELGVSKTQYCKSYLFPIREGKLKIRLIDTPSIVDTTDIDKDNSNIEHILSFISGLKQLNSICILLKPNISKFTANFESYIKKLLSRLNRGASNNLVFVFTNTRSTFYYPGETLPALRKLFEGIRGTTVSLSKANLFSVDSEGFRFLAAYKNGMQFDRKEIEEFCDSWKNSSREVWRMIHYIAGGGPDKNNPLEPYVVKNIISISEARRLIIELSQPLAEIAQLIQDNILLLQDHAVSLNSSTNTVADLKEKMFVPVINLLVTKLEQPITVCTDPGCSEVYEVNNMKKWHYKQRCHDPCYLTNVPMELFGCPELLRCAVMEVDGSNCSRCNCSYQKHMHVYYETKTVEERMEEGDGQKKIEDIQIVTMVVNNLIEKTKHRIEEYENEKDTLLKTMAKFARFLQENAATPYNNDAYQGHLLYLIDRDVILKTTAEFAYFLQENFVPMYYKDAYQHYLLYLIDREKFMGVRADPKIIFEYMKMLEQYEEEKQMLNTSLQKTDSGTETITAHDIINNINDLYNLKHNGKKIKELIAAQNTTRKLELRCETNEYIHSILIRKKNIRSYPSDSEYSTDSDQRQKKIKVYRKRRNKHMQKKNKHFSINNQNNLNNFENFGNCSNPKSDLNSNNFQYPNYICNLENPYNFHNSTNFQNSRNVQNHCNNSAKENFIQMETQEPNPSSTQNVKFRQPLDGLNIPICQCMNAGENELKSSSKGIFKHFTNPARNLTKNYSRQPQILPKNFQKFSKLDNISNQNRNINGGEMQTASKCESSGKGKISWKPTQENFHNLEGDDSDRSSDSSTESYHTALYK